jgi:hypothetical protein
MWLRAKKPSRRMLWSGTRHQPPLLSGCCGYKTKDSCKDFKSTSYDFVKVLIWCISECIPWNGHSAFNSKLIFSLAERSAINLELKPFSMTCCKIETEDLTSFYMLFQIIFGIVVV